MNASSPVESLSGVGPAVASKLANLGIKTVGDLVTFFPRRYEDYSKVSQMSAIKPGHSVTVLGSVKQATGRYVRRGMHITEAIASDQSGSVRIIWFNQPYRKASIKVNQTYYISGNFELSRGRLALMNPAMELESTFPINTARIVPVYRETKGIKSAAIRKIVAGIKPHIEEITENLPAEIIKKHALISRSNALSAMHFPESTVSLEKAKERLGFEELFGLTLASLLNKQQFMHDSGVKVVFDQTLAKQFTASLPYRLTNAQRKVVWQIYKDIESTTPMNRLVEGDVGSGKTAVAAMAAVMVIANKYQVAFMAPTGLLAAQHFDSLTKLLAPVGLDKKIALLVGSMKQAQKKKIHERVKKGEIDLIVGTHALITDSVDMHKLGLIIIDEQHRFGVEQRKKLQAKAGHMPHVLSMTATPIPRTLALTIYGELDISVLDEMPPGRTPTLTKIVSPNSKSPMYEKIRAELSSGRQMFVVCPLIEDSDKLNVLSAESVYKELGQKELKHYKVALLHGKMKAAEKEEIMTEFVKGKVDALISTTVIEVGVDVPNATVMLIEAAERFGLAQLHQLRGRVGRGRHPGICFLVMSDSKEPPRRLKALETTNDGFKLAELDLSLRGPGAIYGVVQSGQLDLRIANLTDAKLIAKARNAAAEFLSSGHKLDDFPSLARRVSRYRSITSLN